MVARTVSMTEATQRIQKPAYLTSLLILRPRSAGYFSQRMSMPSVAPMAVRSICRQCGRRAVVLEDVDGRRSTK
jgi:hypothetical protein